MIPLFLALTSFFTHTGMSPVGHTSLSLVHKTPMMVQAYGFVKMDRPSITVIKLAPRRDADGGFKRISGFMTSFTDPRP